MKHLIIILIFAGFITSCQNKDIKQKDLDKKVKDSANFTYIKWIDSVKDIGIVPPGKTTEINFHFQNAGTRPLYVIEAKPGCGCTLADYPKQPILPGKEGIIKADYNVHKDGQGDFRKTIKVITNTFKNTETYISFYGTIKTDTAIINNKSTN